MWLARPAPQGPRIPRADARGQCGGALRPEQHPQIAHDKGAPVWLTLKDEVERGDGNRTHTGGAFESLKQAVWCDPGCPTVSYWHSFG
jgi:hypothetical protein